MSAPQSSVVHANILLRASALVYGIVAYPVFLASFLYSVGFIGNFSLPTTIDPGAPKPTDTSDRHRPGAAVPVCHPA